MVAFGMIRAGAIGLAVWLSVAPAVAQDRLAVVFGNNRYTVNGGDLDLRSAVADAESYATFLRDKGWFIANYKQDNQNEGEVLDALDRMSVSPGDEIVFVFSGHGWSDTDDYYLVPALPESATEELSYRSPSKLKASSIPLRDIVLELASKTPRRIVIIVDACSDQNFTQATEQKTPSLDYLASLSSEVLILYSSQPGNVAYDSLVGWGVPEEEDHPNSVFTRMFLPQVERSDTLLEAFIKTRINVEARTSKPNRDNLKRQIPTVIYDTIDGSFSLLPDKPLSPVREAIPDPEPDPDAPGAVAEWRNDPLICAADADAIGQAIAERSSDAWSDPEASSASRECIVAGALARLGIEDLRYNVKNNEMVTFTAASAESAIEPGEALERLVIRLPGGGRPEVKARPSMSEFLETLQEYAFRDDVTLGTMISKTGAGARPLSLELGEP